MNNVYFESIWEQIHARYTTAAQAFDKQLFPDLSKRALEEAAAFSTQPLPSTGHELNLRRVSAHKMSLNWAAELKRLKSA